MERLGVRRTCGLVSDERGASLMEYAFGVSCVGVFLMGSVFALGLFVNRTVCSYEEKMGDYQQVQYGEIAPGEWVCVGTAQNDGTYYDVFSERPIDICEYYQC